MKIGIKAIEYHLPGTILTNEQLEKEFGDWSDEKIYAKTGIKTRHISGEDECASDLGLAAAQKLFSSGAVEPQDIDFLLFASQSPDYPLPTTACILQDRLGLPHSCGALDFNLGCSAYIYGLALSKSLIQSRMARQVLLITAETYTKYIHPQDKSTRTIFGDGAAATIIGDADNEIGLFDFGTDGSGKDILIVPGRGSRKHSDAEIASRESGDGKPHYPHYLFMDGAEVLNFTIREVPASVERTLERHTFQKDDIDLFVFHQANKFMLDYLRKKMKIPQEKFYINLEDTGNTVSPSIPIALRRAFDDGRIRKGSKVLLSGFGVGLSWGSTIIQF